MNAKKNRSPLAETGGQLYAFLCLAGLGVIVLLLFSKTHSPAGFVILAAIFLFGMLGILVRTGGALTWMLLLFCFSEIVHQAWFVRGVDSISFLRYAARDWLPHYTARQGFRASWELNAEHILLCFSFLTYAIGLYRLQALGTNIFPIDPRRWKKEAAAKAGRKPKYRMLRVKRPAAQVSGIEVVLALAAIPVCTMIGELCWYWLAHRERVLGFHPHATRVMYFVWILVVGVIIITTVLRHWQGVTRTEEQAEIYLQDTVWHETRREQRRTHRWLAWAEIREENKRKEKS